MCKMNNCDAEPWEHSQYCGVCINYIIFFFENGMNTFAEVKEEISRLREKWNEFGWLTSAYVENDSYEPYIRSFIDDERSFDDLITAVGLVTGNYKGDEDLSYDEIVDILLSNKETTAKALKLMDEIGSKLIKENKYTMEDLEKVLLLK